jgi:flavodoxin short chain
MSKAVVVYWSGTGNTEAMAKAVAEGLREGGAEPALLAVGEAKAEIIDQYDRFAFGCPSMGNEVLEEEEFEPFFKSIETRLAGKKVALFGSYGWGDGQWMRDWRERASADGALVFEEGFIQQEAPDHEASAAFGKRFAAF